jgi:predicted CoA-substrate-specific enzyme activase
MRIGIDIGSRTIKVVVREGSEIIYSKVLDNTINPLSTIRELISPYLDKAEKVVATGYGRNLAKINLGTETITEIRAQALGIREIFPEAELIIDIGGQDSKVIAIGKNGGVENFVMNDKCAAGTGRFLEVMALSLGIPLEEFPILGLNPKNRIKITSMCTVFAESEVVSLKNSGTDPSDLSYAVHLSVAERVSALVHRIGLRENIVFTGGVAKNPLIVKLLEELLGQKILVPPKPEITAALGCTLV